MEYPAYSFGFRVNKPNDRCCIFLCNLISDPLAPASISVIEKDINSIKIKWVYNQERSYVSGWKVSYTQTGTASWTPAINLQVTETDHSISGLTSGQKYTVRVHAVSYQSTESKMATSVDVTVGE